MTSWTLISTKLLSQWKLRPILWTLPHQQRCAWQRAHLWCDKQGPSMTIANWKSDRCISRQPATKSLTWWCRIRRLWAKSRLMSLSSAMKSSMTSLMSWRKSESRTKCKWSIMPWKNSSRPRCRKTCQSLISSEMTRVPTSRSPRCAATTLSPKTLLTERLSFSTLRCNMRNNLIAWGAAKSMKSASSASSKI